MPAYVVANYRISNLDAFAAYPEPAVASIVGQGGEILAADFNSEAMEGLGGPVTFLIKFDDKAAAKAWHASDEYQSVINLRLENTSDGIMNLIDDAA